MKIAFAGFQHETNTFAPTRSGLDAFRRADSWPPMLFGEAVISGTRGLNLPIAGAVREAERRGDVEIVPILWCAAEPTGPVMDDAFDWVSRRMIDALSEARPDAVYLDLHGAMVVESHEDGEGALLARIRAACGPETPIAVSLDLHANISPEMAALATRLAVFRTYPHLDMAETGARALRDLLRVLESGAAPHVAFRQAPFLAPGHAQCTDIEPCRSLYADLQADAAHDGECVEMAMGFPAADVRDCGPAIVAYADRPERAEALAEAALDRLLAAEATLDASLPTAEEAVLAAIRLAGPKPVVIADVQDNPGAGGSSDTTGLLRALVSCGAGRAVLGVMHDPDAAATAHRLGVGARFDAALGGRSGVRGDAPFAATLEVVALGDGRIPYLGEMYAGGVAEIGPSALLRVEDERSDILVVTSSARNQCLDRAFFTTFGLDLAEAQIIVVKSTVHFRADFEPIAGAILSARAPGLFVSAPAELPFKNLRPGVRLQPAGRAPTPAQSI